MKKFFAMLFAFLLVAFLATTFNSHEKKAVVKDVGYSLTIDQNMITTPVFIADIQISRGVSVPYKGLILDVRTYFNVEKTNFLMCRIDNYSQIWQRSVSTNLVLPVKGIDLLACDLGNWERYSKINII